MLFINRKEEREYFKNRIIKKEPGRTKIFIIESEPGIGKTALINEVCQELNLSSLLVMKTNGEIANYGRFRRFIYEIDKRSEELGIPSFDEFYNNKAKKKRIFNYIKTIFDFLIFIATKGRFFSASNRENAIKCDNFIFSADIEYLFNYAKNCISKIDSCIIFENADNIDEGSLDLLSKLTKTACNILLFECSSSNGNYISKMLKNDKICMIEKYELKKLTLEHINEYISEIAKKHNIDITRIDKNNILSSIESGNLEEISNSIEVFSKIKSKNDTSILLSLEQQIEKLSNEEIIVLMLIMNSYNRLTKDDIKNIMKKYCNVEKYCIENPIQHILDRKIAKEENELLILSEHVFEILNSNESYKSLRDTAYSLVYQYINNQLDCGYSAKYLDILLEINLEKKYINQIIGLTEKIRKRIRLLGYHKDRVNYFDIVLKHKNDFKDNTELIKNLISIAYDSNLYEQALELFNQFSSEDIIKFKWVQALILNRCEKFADSNDVIDGYLKNKNTKEKFNYKLLKIMNNIQLKKQDLAYNVYNQIKDETEEPLYPYLYRLSNVFENNFEMKMTIVENSTKKIEKLKGNNHIKDSYISDFIALHYIYLCYIYTINERFVDAEKMLELARPLLRDCTSYNHMLLHNQATIKLYKGEKDDSIETLLQNALVTAYDEYDKISIYNNLLIYYIKKNQISSKQCLEVVSELENRLNETEFQRFLDKVRYNLYHYYKKMYNNDRLEILKKQLKSSQDLDSEFEPQYMYETSWKLPLFW